MSPMELTTFITAMANIIARDLSENELALLASMLTQTADTLETIAAVRALANPSEEEPYPPITPDAF